MTWESCVVENFKSVNSQFEADMLSRVCEVSSRIDYVNQITFPIVFIFLIIIIVLLVFILLNN